MSELKKLNDYNSSLRRLQKSARERISKLPYAKPHHQPQRRARTQSANSEAKKLLDKPLTNRAFFSASPTSRKFSNARLRSSANSMITTIDVPRVRATFKSVTRTLMPTIQFLDSNEREGCRREKEIEKFNDSLPMNKPRLRTSELFCGATEISARERAASASIEMTYFRLGSLLQ